MRSLSYYAFLIGSFCLLPLAINATTNSWTGGTNSNFSTSTNWTPNKADPTHWNSTDDAEINTASYNLSPFPEINSQINFAQGSVLNTQNASNSPNGVLSIVTVGGSGNNAGDLELGGTLTNGVNFTILNQNIFNELSTGTIVNNGKIGNQSSGTNLIGILNVGGTLTNNGLIQNNSGLGALPNQIELSGTFTNSSSGNLVNQANALFISTNSGSFTNNGTATNSGTFSNGSLGSFANVSFRNLGTFNNSGTFDHFGQLIVAGNNLGIFNNSGTFISESSSNFNEGLSSIALNNSFNNSGIMNISGAFTNFSGTLTNNSSGSININSGGTLDSIYTGTFNNQGTVTINANGVLQNDASNGSPTITNMNNAKINNNGGAINNINGGTLTNQNGGTINNNSGTVTNASGSFFTSGGVFNNASQFTNSASFTNSAGTFNNSGTTTNSGSIVNSGLISNTSIINNLSGGTILSNNGGTYTEAGTLNNQSGATFTNDGAVYASYTIANGGKLNNSGTFNNINGGILAVQSGGNLTNTGTLTNSGSLSNLGTVVNNGTISSSNLFTNQGSYYGTGTFQGNFTNSSTGLVSAGNPTGVVTGTTTIAGQLTNQGVLQVDLGGASFGSYDTIFVNNGIVLSGAANTLQAQLVNGFNPTLGQIFAIIGYNGTLTGTFANLSLPTLANGLGWLILYNNPVNANGYAYDIQLDVVAVAAPEPQTYLLLGSFLMIIGFVTLSFSSRSKKQVLGNE